MNPISDKVLLDLCRKRDRAAQHKLYLNCYSFLMSICARYKKNKEDAEEILNIGFLKILNNLDKYRNEIPFTLWMRRVMINTLIDDFRKNKKEKEMFQQVDFNEYFDEGHSNVVNTYVSRMDAEELQAMINSLPEMSGKVFNLFAVDGYSHKEISDMLGISEGTSKWHVNFARNKLKELLDNSVKQIKIAAT
ncbi:MAG: RNA polymerase sigma factor [Bacteroidia bacterium]|nr:RNA polymerase sigma factor [Bacteroidia bacterium]